MSDRQALLHRMVMNHTVKLIQNFLDRGNYLNHKLDAPPRDLDAECGYTKNPTIEDYHLWYEREGFATRVVDLPADETWQYLPEYYETNDDKETDSEKYWQSLLDDPELNPWHFCHRVDKVSGIGRYGVLLLGFDDVDDAYGLDQPVKGLKNDGTRAAGRPGGVNLKFIRVFSERHARISQIDNDQSSMRIGKPLTYQMMFADVVNSIVMGGTDNAPMVEGGESETVEPIEVHHTRVIHVPGEMMTESEIFAMPRLQTVLNRCHDLRKILGGSAEMFWKGGFPGYSVESLPDHPLLSSDAIDKESIQEEFQMYMHGLQRYLAVEGVTIKSLNPQIGDPEKHVFQQLLMIACSIGCPLHVLLGNDAGQAASAEQTSRWHSRVSRRQKQHAEPRIARALINRLMLVGAMPQAKRYFLSWKDLNAVKDTDKADIALKTAQALLQYVTSGSEKVMPLFYFIVNVLQWDADLAKTIEDKVKAKGYEPLTREVWKQTGKQPPGSGLSATANKTNTQTNSQGQVSRNQT